MKTKHRLHLVGLVGFSLLLIAGLGIGFWLSQQSQDTRPRASGEECYLAIRSEPDQTVGIIKALGGVQTSDGHRYCVSGTGDRYRNYYLSREEGLADLTQPPYPCQSATVNLDGYDFTVGDTCFIIDSIQGKLICVGGPEIEYWGCVSNQSGNYYRRVGEKTVVGSRPVNTPTPDEVCTIPGPSYVRAVVRTDSEPMIRVSWPKDDQVDDYQFAICRKLKDMAEPYSCEIVVQPDFNFNPADKTMEYLDRNIKCGYQYQYQVGTVKTQGDKQCYGSTASNVVEVDCQEPPEPPICNQPADLNCDGKVDIIDYGLFLKQFRLFD